MLSPSKNPVINYYRRLGAHPDYAFSEAAVMVNDPAAPAYIEAETAATLALLPRNFFGKTGVELGCGVGRLTVGLAQRVKHFTAYELLPEFAEAARKKVAGEGLTNVEIICGDAAEAVMPPVSYDLIVMKWICMYLDDERADRLIRRAVHALRLGGLLLFHESVDPGADPSPENKYPPCAADEPQRYRHELWYLNRLEKETGWANILRHDFTDFYGGAGIEWDIRQMAFVLEK
jgi:SAM-dependent methyltransferase